LARTRRYLLDVNVLVALTTRIHEHHAAAREWFHAAPDLKWALCAFTEAGLLRTLSAPHTAQITMAEANAVLADLKRHPGYRYQPITADWHELCSPFFKRLMGHRQITDAYLLGIAVHEELVLVTFDRAFRHLAGDHLKHVLILNQP
jgi:uncharacterized protein